MRNIYNVRTDVNDLDLRLTDGGELTHSYANEGEVKMTKQEIITMIERSGFEAVERDTVYNRASQQGKFVVPWMRVSP